MIIKESHRGDFPGGPGVRIPAPTAGGVGSVSGGGTKISYALRCGQKN